MRENRRGCNVQTVMQDSMDTGGNLESERLGDP